MTELLGSIREEIAIARGIEHVWETLTSEASAPIWLGCMRYRQQIGATFFMQQDEHKASRDDISGATHCKIVALEAPLLFKFSWFLPGLPETFVSFRLQRIDDVTTRVVLEHEGWEQFPAEQIKPIRDMLLGGWKSFVLPNLKRAAEV